MKFNILKEWFLKRAQLEEGLEIGAGSLSHKPGSEEYKVMNNLGEVTRSPEGDEQKKAKKLPMAVYKLLGVDPAIPGDDVSKPFDAEPLHHPCFDLPIVGGLMTPDEYSAKHAKYLCFHCKEEFVGDAAAIEHFGPTCQCKPLCQVSRADYETLQNTLKCYREEDTGLHRKLVSLRAEHADALRREEEKGYARGLKDGKQMYRGMDSHKE